MLWPSSLWALNLDRSSGPSCVDLGLLTGFAEDGIPYPMSLARLLGTFGLGFLKPIQKSEVPSTEDDWRLGKGHSSKKGLPYVGVKKAPSLIGEALLNEKESLQEVREGIIKEIDSEGGIMSLGISESESSKGICESNKWMKGYF
ncbi:hypothetical protein FXO37_19078 [Capsicum annuum]|nr:hypothetical protein FXO37_19078 [Capsicum annuum]